MKSNKPLVIIALFVFAVMWVTLMALVSMAAGSVRASGSGSGQARAGVEPWSDDGNIKTEITSITRDSFKITVTVKVTGKDGKLVPGLGKNEIEVFEDGELVNITNLIPAGQAPVRVCLVIDYSQSMNGQKIEGAKKAALALLDTLRDNTDHLGLYFFNGALAKTNSTELLPMGQLTPDRRAQAKQAIETTKLGGGTPMYDGMERAFTKLESLPGRRVMVVLTDGKDTTARGDAAKNQRIGQLGETAVKQGVPINPISLGTGKGSKTDDEVGMRKLAEAGKGKYIHAPSPEDLKGIYMSVAETLSNEYVIEYESPNPIEDGSNRNVTVAARNGPSGNEANTSYLVPGLISTGAGRRPAAGNPTASTGIGPFGIGMIFVPLALLLGAAFLVPYARWLRPSTTPPTEPPAAPPAVPAPAASAPNQGIQPPAPPAVAGVLKPIKLPASKQGVPRKASSPAAPPPGPSSAGPEAKLW